MSETPQVRLRGHHLICLQFFRGEGYSAEFADNLARVVDAAMSQPALIVAGADSVCTACPELGPDSRCDSESSGGEGEIARIDGLALEVLGVSAGETISLADARARLEADAVGVGMWRSNACDGCTWEMVCEPGWRAMLASAERAARASG